jgi:hypothetical protein
MIAADFAAAVSAEACEDGNSPPELLLGAASADISQWLVRMVIHQHLFLVLQLLQWLQVRMMADQQQHNPAQPKSTPRASYYRQMFKKYSSKRTRTYILGIPHHQVKMSQRVVVIWWSTHLIQNCLVTRQRSWMMNCTIVIKRRGTGSTGCRLIVGGPNKPCTEGMGKNMPRKR